MCRCCQDCLESCYWHLIEKRFCFDESIALYEEPVKKDEKNNNIENMAFYDSVSVIAGRAIVTIDPPQPKSEIKPIVQQPTKRLKWGANNPKILSRSLSKSVPAISEEKPTDTESSEDDQSETKVEKLKPPEVKLSKSLSTSELGKKITVLDPRTLGSDTDTKKSLRERRMSKSLYLKIDGPKELPIIRQQSMPKFYLDTPEDNQSDSTLCRAPSAVLTSPVINNNPDGFEYDLYSVVQREKTKSWITPSIPVPVHKDQSKRFLQIKERMKLKKSKSTVNTITLVNQNPNTSLPS